MLRVPSATSGRLGQFVRRVRENAFELQTVGSTRLENQIQSLFGGTQIKNLPQSLQQIIAEDRALGGGGGGGPLTLVNPFTNDNLTLDQQKAAANQMAFQQGANPPFPEVQQAQEQNSVVEAARQALSNLQPLIQQGLLSQKDASGIVRSVALDNVLDANEQGKAARDVKAASQQFASGQINQQQLASTMESIRAEHKNESLNLIPEWRELTGTESQFQAQVGEAVAAKAKSFGLPVDAFRFDSKTGAVVKNEEWFEIDAYKTKKATEAAKPILEERKAARKAVDLIFETDKRQLEVRRQATSKSDPVAAANSHNSDLRAITQIHQQELARINALGGGGAAPPPEQPQPSAPPPAETVQGLPPGVALFGAFPDVQSVIDAKPPTGSYFTIRGQLGRRRTDGRYEPVQ